MPPGIYKRIKPVWNKGLTKEADSRVAKHPGSFQKGGIPWNKGTHGLQPPPLPKHLALLKQLNSKLMKINNPMKNKSSLAKMVLTNIKNGAYIKMGKRASERMRVDNPMFKREVIKKHPTLHSGWKYRSGGEVRVGKVLKSLNLEVKFQYRIRKCPSKRSYFLDFYLPNFNVGIEFDGDSRHFTNPKSDEIRDKWLLRNRNIRILRIIPKDLNSIGSLKNKITNFLLSGFKFQKIKKITKIHKLVKVYDLTVNKNKNFFVDKKLVHNCPMPLNADTYDAVRCPYGCRYCFADSFRASLYTSFFDNSKNLGMRTCNPSFFRSEMDKLMKHRGTKSKGSELQRAIAMQIPIRLGIRFEDFLPIENRKRVSYDFLSYLKDEAYPVMVNTKSSLIGNEDYVRVLADNEGGSAVHITVISSDDNLNKLLEPAAPPFMERITAAKSLSEAGVRVVARIEPFMIFINDDHGKVDDWISAVKWAGIDHVTLDTYSWSATSPGIKRQMEMEGVDFERVFLLMSDSQFLGSILLGKFIEYLRENGLSCSTFDFGNVPNNSDDVCCCVGDLFLSKGVGFSYGNNLMAIRYIQSYKGRPVIWGEYDKFVESKGGWLSENLRQEVFRSWNCSGSPAYGLDWAQGIESCGRDKDGNMVWRYVKANDFRLEMLEGLIYGLA